MNSPESILMDAENFCRYAKEQTGIAIDGKVSDDVFDPVIEAYMKKQGLSYDEAADRTASYWAFQSWRKTKAVYLFDDSLLAALRETEDTQMHIEMMRRLPVSSFFISPKTATPGTFLGAFITVEISPDNTCLVGVVIISDHDEANHRIASHQHCMRFAEGESIETVVARLIESDYNQFAPEMKNSSFEYMYKEPLTMAVNAAYYLSAINSDVKAVKTAKGKKVSRPNGTKLTLRKWEVGYRIGATLSTKGKADREGDASEKVRHGTERPRPHLRRAHWHHYWCGEGRTRLEVRWIAPCFVNAESEEDLIATEHKIGE